jgi:hypothetical protein
MTPNQSIHRDDSDCPRRGPFVDSKLAALGLKGKTWPKPTPRNASTREGTQSVASERRNTGWAG